MIQTKILKKRLSNAELLIEFMKILDKYIVKMGREQLDWQVMKRKMLKSLRLNNKGFKSTFNALRNKVPR